MITIKKQDFEVSVFETGHLRSLIYDGILVNQTLQNPLEHRLGQIYLRAKGKTYPLLDDKAKFSHSDSVLKYEGKLPVGTYTVSLFVHDTGWFYEVKTNLTAEYDLIYLQDMGLADVAAVRTNEAYMAQYIDYKIVEDKVRGKIVLARQNQPRRQNEFPKAEIGSLTKITRYVTDGFDFVGPRFKLGEPPQGLKGTGLINRKRQYEVALIGLQTGKLKGQSETVFYGLLDANSPEATKDAAVFEAVKALYDETAAKGAAEIFKAGRVMTRKLTQGADVIGLDADMDQLLERYPERLFEEKAGDKLLSFFTPSYSHVVLKEKEAYVDRSHGMVLLDQVELLDPENTLAATVYMTGVFQSHVVLGNTNLNKFSSHQRNPLNLLTTSGLRVYIKEGNALRLLAMPTMFKMKPNKAKWVYDLPDDTLVVKTWVTNTSKEVKTRLVSKGGKSYDFVVTNQISMGPNEYDGKYTRAQRDGKITYKPAGFTAYPNSRYVVSGNYDKITDESYIAAAAKGTAEMDVFLYEGKSELQIGVQASLYGDFAEEQEGSRRDFYKGILNQFELQGDSEWAQKYNLTAYWYTHQTLVHYASPHGLEQGSGAAWGTRDVCQGPFEFFWATGRTAELRQLILTIYSNQFEETGEWPQWFMFDKYTSLRQDDSHGDVIVWPMKIIGDYLELTGDKSILEEKIPYVSFETKVPGNRKTTLLAHIKKEVATIKSQFMPGTALSNYGDGDWDDTLQPANKDLKKGMISSWTVALTYQAMKKLGEQLPDGDVYIRLAERIKTDFHKYALKGTDVIPGFLYMPKPGKVEYMIHPQDKKTKISYRLLPMTRSVIAELVSPEQMEKNFALIEEHLLCPDGVHLMNKPAHYEGGVSKHFKRAEQASNFGREVGLQYVHAHIRYIESLAKAGDTRALNMLALINPIDIGKFVPNAARRQANTYFSSSDAAFLDRYQAQKEYGRVKKGDIEVNGGWRIYSSGPGIYMNQLIRNILGIRQTSENFVFDPVLSADLDGLQVKIELDGRLFHITFCHGPGKEVTIDDTTYTDVLDNPYRMGALFVPKTKLPEGEYEVEIMYATEE